MLTVYLVASHQPLVFDCMPPVSSFVDIGHWVPSSNDFATYGSNFACCSEIPEATARQDEAYTLSLI